MKENFNNQSDGYKPSADKITELIKFGLYEKVLNSISKNVYVVSIAGR